MMLTKLSCKACGRVWYVELVGKSLREVADTLMTMQCPTEECDGVVVMHAGEVTASET